MKQLLVNGYRAKKRPSGHEISDKFGRNNGAAIPPKLLAIPNTDSNGFYLRYCRERGIEPHPARFPAELPEFFIRMLTDQGDTVLDPFAGSCVTGEVCERLARRWICVEVQADYLQGALGRFVRPTDITYSDIERREDSEAGYYQIPRPGLLWNGGPETPLAADGGKTRGPVGAANDSDKPIVAADPGSASTVITLSTGETALRVRLLEDSQGRAADGQV